MAPPGNQAANRENKKTIGKRYDRSFYPQGMARQLVAILTHGNKAPALSSIKVLTPFIHGTSGPLVSVEGGKDTAKAIPGAQLIFIERMGQDLPHGGARPRIVEALTKPTQKA